jgi:hypothetical protein
MDARDEPDPILTATEHTERAERDLRDALDAEQDDVEVHARSVERGADDLHELAKDAVARAAMLRERRRG